MVCARVSSARQSTVSTWSMLKWAAVVTIDLGGVASKATKMNAIKGAHSWCDPRLLC